MYCLCSVVDITLCLYDCVCTCVHACVYVCVCIYVCTVCIVCMMLSISVLLHVVGSDADVELFSLVVFVVYSCYD